MGNLLLPDDPNWKQPIIMGDPYANELTPRLAEQKRVRELDAQREAQSGGMFKYASSGVAIAPDPFMKNAQMTGVNNMMTQPMWFSPLHTPQNWQIASKRREIYQWLNISPVIGYDFTYQEIGDLNFTCDEVIEDTVTGGLLYENINCEPILSGSGQFRKPPRYAVRHCDQKLMFEFSVYGFWRTIIVSEEHPMIVLDGKTYRHKKKLESDANLILPQKLIGRKESHDVTDQDYLLAPVPSVGTNKLVNDQSWLLGVTSADGSLSNYIKGDQSKAVSITLDKREMHRSEIVRVLDSFPGKTSERKHHSKYGWRITKYTGNCWDFCSKYMTGKLNAKKFTANVFDLDKESRLHVLGGYFDGDGSFSKAEGKLIANNYSCDMADQIYWLLLSVGIRASLGRYPLYGDHYETDSKWVYRIFIPQSDISILKPYMRSNKIPDDFIPRKTRELRFFYEEDGVIYLAQPIESIKQFRYTGPGYDLQIDPERSFVASGFVTSNCRFFYENEPKVAAAIDFYSRFPMNGFKLDCKDHKIWRYYLKKVVPKLELNEKFKMISSEYYMLGDVFVHTDIECPICGGSGVDPDSGESCNHPGGLIKSIKILNPDWMEVQQSILADEPSIVMVPDEELKRIVFYKQPKNIYDSIPDAVKRLIIQNKPIPMSARTISHIKHMPVPYGTYGSSLIRRLFTTLAYKTKIMTANWIVAERLILPVRVVKIGSDNRPATTADIADIQQQLAATANDPNLTIVTHHNFEYEWYGAAGKILQVTQEMENIGKEILDGFMLNQSLLNGEMCIPEYDRMLTRDGFKSLHQITEDDEVATFNRYTGELEYQKPTAIHQYDWDGDLMHFQTDRIDFACTPNHRMLYQKRDHNEWVVDTADTVRDRSKFRKTVNWKNYVTEENGYSPFSGTVSFGKYEIPLDDMLKIMAYYVSEGHIQKETRKCRSTFGEPSSVQISQTEKGKGWEDLCTLRKESIVKISKTRHGFGIHNKEFAKYLMENCGHLSSFKKVPKWVKDKPAVVLSRFLGYLINGDGALRTRDKNGPKKYYTYYTKSLQLKDDVMEIAMKCGYFPRYRKRRNIWEITFSDYDLGRETITLESKKHDTITKMPYKGKVWCATVPNSFIVTERNGKLMISGNSGYQSAQVGVETLIRRVESWRHTLAEWCEKRVFKPIAEMQGFVDEEESEELNETIFLYPTIKWNDLNLKDKSQWYLLLNQLHDKQLISAQTLLEELDLDYDQEVKRMRHEQMAAGPQMAPMGGLGGGQDPMGGMMGGMMGGGGGGGAPMPGADPMMGGGGPAPADAGMMGGAGMGGMDQGMMAPMAQGGKVLKKGKQSKMQKQHEGETPEGGAPSVMLTTIEQEMVDILLGLAEVYRMSPQAIQAQFAVQNPTGAKPYVLDFAFPFLKLGVECDGDVWHSNPEQESQDKERDYLLAQRGWTILRFDDKTIEEARQAVQNTIGGFLDKAIKAKNSNNSKQASKGDPQFTEEPQLYTLRNGNFIKTSDYKSYLGKFFKPGIKFDEARK